MRDVSCLRSGWRPGDGDRLLTLDDCREAWELNRERLMSLRDPKGRGGFGGHWPGERPWAWWMFEQDEPDPPRTILVAGVCGWESEETRRLDAMGELTAEERAMLDRDAAAHAAELARAADHRRVIERHYPRKEQAVSA